MNMLMDYKKSELVILLFFVIVITANFTVINTTLN